MLLQLGTGHAGSVGGPVLLTTARSRVRGTRPGSGRVGERIHAAVAEAAGASTTTARLGWVVQGIHTAVSESAWLTTTTLLATAWRATAGRASVLTSSVMACITTLKTVQPPKVVGRTAHGTASGEHEHEGELGAHHVEKMGTRERGKRKKEGREGSDRKYSL